jgi:hypothetical protein
MMGSSFPRLVPFWINMLGLSFAACRVDKQAGIVIFLAWHGSGQLCCVWPLLRLSCHE